MIDRTSWAIQTARVVGLFALLVCVVPAYALGFGPIRVDSSLNEPLDATLDLVALSSAEQSSLDVDVASAQMFARFGIERSALVDRLRIDTTSVGDGRATVRLTTRGPVREPFLRLLIQATTAGGSALREYTVLLDPPGMAPIPPQTSASPSPPTGRRDESSRSTESLAEIAQTPETRRNPDRYGPVRRGDTLSAIAARMQRPGTSMAQMQVAIFQDNPNAFGGTIDLLRRGATLSIPSATQVRAIDEQQALAVIRGQRAQQTATESPAAAPAQSGQVVVDQAAEPPGEATLRLQPPQPVSDDEAQNEAQDGAFFGRLVMPDVAVSSSTEPAPGTGAPPSAGQGRPAAGVDAGETDVVAVESSANESLSLSDSSASNLPTDAPVPSSADTVVASPAASNGDSGAASGAGSAGVAEDGLSAAPAVDADDEYEPVTGDAADVAGVSEGGVVTPINLILIGLLLALLALFVVWNRRRQYKRVELSFDEADDSDTGTDTPMAGTQPDAEAQTDVPAPMPLASAVSSEPTPSARVLDADRHMKQGEFEAARLTLEQGLQSNPEDSGLQDKRLELDYLLGDVAGFDTDIDRFGTALAGNGVRWAGVAAMGRVLMPGDARFNSSASLGARPVGVSTPPPFGDTRAEVADYDKAHHDEDEVLSAPDRRSHVDPPQASRLDSAAIGHTPDDSVDAQRPDMTLSLDEPQAPAPPRASVHEPAAQAQAISLDEDNTEIDEGLDWQFTDLGAGQEREHDRGDDAGLDFELDTTPYNADDVQARGDRADGSAARASSMSMIDTSEFDLGDAGVSDDPSFETESDADSIEIRLELARMYIEMEDAAAARELLEECLAQGTDSQKAEARTLLDSL